MEHFSRSEKVQPAEFNRLRSFDGQNSVLRNDFITKKRKRTDTCFFIFFTTFFLLLLLCLAYCVYFGNIFRVLNGYDNCAFVCGWINANLPDTIRHANNCDRINLTMLPFHIVVEGPHPNEYDRLCVANCHAYPGYRQLMNRCIPEHSLVSITSFFSKTGLNSFFVEVAEDFHVCWREFGYLCLISFACSIIIMILFKYLVGFVVWLILIAAMLASLIGTITLWILWKKSNEMDDTTKLKEIDPAKTETYMAFSIAATIVTVIIILIIFVMRKRISLVVQLFKESGKAITNMPCLLLEPFLTFLAVAATLSMCLYFCLWIESSGNVVETDRLGVYRYEKNVWMKIIRWYHVFAMLWLLEFIIGCQHMVIAGAVSIWYFKRRKMKWPVLQSFYNLVRYHLSSVAVGAFLISLVQFARFVLNLVDKCLKKREGQCAGCMLKSCRCCLYCFEIALKYITRNAYIEIAIHGCSFYTASQKAFRLLSNNAVNVATINSVGDFVLFLGKVVVVTVTVIIGIRMLQDKEGIQHIWVPLALAGLVAYFVAHCFMSIFEMVIDTIFLCFCEDCEMNDGVSKPYYMSRGLMEFVENSKKVLELYDNRNVFRNAWKSNLVTVSDVVDQHTK